MPALPRDGGADDCQAELCAGVGADYRASILAGGRQDRRLLGVDADSAGEGPSAIIWQGHDQPTMEVRASGGVGAHQRSDPSGATCPPSMRQSAVRSTGPLIPGNQRRQQGGLRPEGAVPQRLHGQVSCRQHVKYMFGSTSTAPWSRTLRARRYGTRRASSSSARRCGRWWPACGGTCRWGGSS